MRQKGFILFFVMVFLVIISLLGISMFSGFIKDQKIAGNFREKSRALDAAQAAMDAAQNILGNSSQIYTGDWNAGQACPVAASSSTVPVLTICSNAISSPAQGAWASTSYSFAPSNLSVSTSGANTYSAAANYYYQYLGTTSTNPPSALYKITTMAQGGDVTSTAVLETVFQATALARDVSGE